jgi:VanZ family protein
LVSLPKGRNFLRYWLPVLVWCGVILALSGDLGSSKNTEKPLQVLLPNLSPAHFGLIHGYLRRALGHFGTYGFLYFLWFRAFRADLGYRGGRAFLWSLGLCLAMSLLNEGHKLLLVSRTPSVMNVGRDLAGSSGAALILTIFRIYAGTPMSFE